MKFSLVGATTLACFHQGSCIEDGVVLLQSQVQTSEELTAFQSLLPDLASLKDPRKNRVVLAQIQQTVTSLAADASQITPAVQALVTTIVTTLTDTALPPILTDHAEDQEALDGTSNFTADGQLQNSAEQLNLTPAIGCDFAALQTCFTTEHRKCNDLDDCEESSTAATNNWTIANNHLIMQDVEIDTKWCQQSEDHTFLTFREESKDLFINYNNALAALEAAAADTNATNVVCDGLQATLGSTVLSCNVREQACITGGCSAYQQVADVVEEYTSLFSAKVVALQDEKARVRLREADRKVEWDVLKRVICLLGTLTSTTSDGSLSEINGCSSMMVPTTELDIMYPNHPDMLVLPDTPDHPCSDDFTAQLAEPETNCSLVIGDITFEPPVPGDPICTALCEASPPAATESPDLTSYFLLLVNPMTTAQFVFTSAPGGGQTWQVTSADGTAITGSASLTYADGDSTYGVFHGAPALNEEYVDANLGKETTEESLLRLGGFFYNRDGVTTVKLIAPSSVQIGSAETQTLSFGDKTDITESPCTFQPVPDDSWAPEGAIGYCFLKQPTLECCTAGCFIFNYNSQHYPGSEGGYTCYPVTGL